MIMTYEQDIKDMTVTKSLRFLRDGFKNEFATFAYSDMRMNELLVELANEFVCSNIPVVDEENQIELALMLLETVDLISR